jgi:hypothetical protein
MVSFHVFPPSIISADGAGHKILVILFRLLSPFPSYIPHESTGGVFFLLSFFIYWR